MTEQPQAPPTEQIYGIAKKIALELEKLPLHTHAGIINMVRTMVEHRKIELESKANEAQVEAQKAAYADAVQAHAKAQVQARGRRSREGREAGAARAGPCHRRSSARRCTRSTPFAGRNAI